MKLSVIEIRTKVLIVILIAMFFFIGLLKSVFAANSYTVISDGVWPVGYPYWCGIDENNIYWHDVYETQDYFPIIGVKNNAFQPDTWSLGWRFSCNSTCEWDEGLSQYREQDNCDIAYYEGRIVYLFDQYKNGKQQNKCGGGLKTVWPTGYAHAINQFTIGSGACEGQTRKFHKVVSFLASYNLSGTSSGSNRGPSWGCELTTGDTCKYIRNHSGYCDEQNKDQFLVVDYSCVYEGGLKWRLGLKRYYVTCEWDGGDGNCAEYDTPDSCHIYTVSWDLKKWNTETLAWDIVHSQPDDDYVNLTLSAGSYRFYTYRDSSIWQKDIIIDPSSCGACPEGYVKDGTYCKLIGGTPDHYYRGLLDRKKMSREYWNSMFLKGGYEKRN